MIHFAESQLLINHDAAISYVVARKCLTGGRVQYNQGNEGGGLQISNGATVTINNTIVAENKNAAGTTNTDVYGALTSSTYNLIGLGGSGGLTDGINGNIVLTSGSAGLAPLADYGGPTFTHALLEDSPAIDAGDNDFVDQYDLVFDQRGQDFDRIVDWGIDERVDIGAFELAADELFT